MAQQPNVEVPTPRSRTVAPGPADRWDPGQKPGVISRPDDVPTGAGFGSPGPDPGWVLGLVKRFEIPDRTPALEAVVAAVAAARAAAIGRASVPEDIRAALTLCGIGENLPEYLGERRARWIAAVPHEKSKGQSAVGEIGGDLLVLGVERIRYALNHTQARS